MTVMARRAVQVTAVVLVAVLAIAGPASASRGGIFVHDSDDCTGNGNASRVTLPFSVSGRSYPPFTDLEIFATDKRADETFGPFVVTTDASGAFCALVRVARATQWKLDLVEPGPGSTDSKVFWVEPSSPTTTEPAPTVVPTTGSPTTTVPAPTTSPTTSGPTTTLAGPTTTVGGPTTTTVGGSTTTVAGGGATTTAPPTPTTTVAPTTPTSVVASSTTVDTEVDPPIDIEQIPRPESSTTVAAGGGTPTLPATGADDPTAPLVPALVLIGIGVTTVLVVRRRHVAAP